MKTRSNTDAQPKSLTRNSTAMKKDTNRKGYDFGSGFLIIGVYTETKAFPVCDAEIKIYRSEHADKCTELPISVKTDTRGFSPPVALTVTAKRHSEVSSSSVKYDFFDVVISKPGYIETKVKRLPVFDGVISVRQCEISAEAKRE